ncbi:hypothetical protein LZ30DRAFT_806286 [Colletotrichum cereale]|nr:hypothetical protein LZ30DRAFT_806286 [Colletotrichum cereale]
MSHAPRLLLLLRSYFLTATPKCPASKQSSRKKRRKKKKETSLENPAVIVHYLKKKEEKTELNTCAQTRRCSSTPS